MNDKNGGPQFANFNSQVVEQANSILKRTKSSISYMNKENLMAHCKLLLWYWNQNRLQPLSKWVSANSNNFPYIYLHFSSTLLHLHMHAAPTTSRQLKQIFWIKLFRACSTCKRHVTFKFIMSPLAMSFSRKGRIRFLCLCLSS